VPIIVREGWAIIAGFAVATGAAWYLGWRFFGWPGHIGGGLGLILTAWSAWFFRDPARSVPTEPGLVISPADGLVCYAGPGQPPAELKFDGTAGAGMTRISVFMNVFNVHVNRCPVDATIAAVDYRPGKFFNASLDKASEHNERCSLRLRPSALPTADMACVQIAGLIARRIVCKVGPGASLRAGQRFGLIRFGSRVDVYLPRGVQPLVGVGDRSVAGETVFARLIPPEPR
jgi:phosphatidylserine decarboxylase